ncbi:MAG: bifunctional transaldolase/phosoglucose isomerase [Candidatus Dormibacteria bacterium]
MPSPLHRLRELGQSVWLDYISRELVTSGRLQRLIEESAITGLTSNPTIFEKALAEGTDYDQHIRELVDSRVTDPNDIFLGLAISDIQRAADILAPVHRRTGGADGFVSLEVPPALAHNTETTVATAREVWERVARPNLMIKIPATSEGVPAIQQAVAAGLNVNVTLIFSLESYENVIHAYLGGLHARRERGESLDVHSVASFFVSRVDTAVDGLLQRRLAEDPGNPLLEGLLGKAAIANAVLAYELFERVFKHGANFAELRSQGAHVQRPLWASTSAKNPSYRDVIYAEALIGPDTVDTMPPATIEAFSDHGIVAGSTVSLDYAGAHETLEALGRAGIDMEAVTRRLLEEGVASFTKSYDALVRVIAEKADALHGGFGRRQILELAGDTTVVAAAMASAETATTAARLWERDPNLWKPGDSHHAAVIANRLGWLDVVGTMREELPNLLRLAAEVREEGVRDAVLLGMGGSSLCPEVLRASLGSAAGHPRLHVLDTTDPAAIASVTEAVEPRETLFIVASKSGTTLETLCHLSHFWEVVRESGITDPGRRFLAITDPGSSLATLAGERSFRRIFENPSDIGGRYSALSYFGLVPAAIMGLDVETLLDRADAMRMQCSAGIPGELNCGLVLGTVLGRLAITGRDKVTIVSSEPVAAFSLWVEQLIAESTGKEGRGIVPIGGEALGCPDVYGDDRLFVALRVGSESSTLDSRIASLRQAGLPVVTIEMADLYDLGAEFFRWEFATAVAGAVMGIDPFDEPNVQESKDNTTRVLAESAAEGRVPEEPPTVSEYGTSVYGGPPADSLDGALSAFLGGVTPPDYIALMAYVTPSPANDAALQELRTALRDRHRTATTLGFGPRFLHSTGQLHKGGPNTGVFIQITADDAGDVPIPGRPFTFSLLKRAQARGDLLSLRSHGRRVIHVHVGADVEMGVRRLSASMHQPLGTTG